MPSYRGTVINGNNQASIQAQMAAIDARLGARPGTNQGGVVQGTSPLPVTTPPSNAGQIQSNVGQVRTPTNSPNMGNPVNAVASTAGAQANIDALTQQRQDQLALDQKNETARLKQNQTFLQSITSGFNPAQTRADSYETNGINPADYFADQKRKIAEIDSLNKDYNAVVKRRDQQIAQTQGALASMDFINNQTAQINRNAAPVLSEMSANINSHAAVLEALQGNFAQATSLANQAVQDATSQYQFKVDAFKTFYQMNQDAIDRMDNRYKEAFNAEWESAKMKLETETQDKKAIADLMTTNPQAGISLNDTYEQALQKYQAAGGDPLRAAQIANQRRLAAGDGEGASGGGFKNSKIESDVRGDVVELIYSQGLTPAEAYQRLRTLYSTAEVSDIALNSLLGITPAAETPATEAVITPGAKLPQASFINRIGQWLNNAFGAKTNISKDKLFQK
jgi:hypothetical protein